MGQATGPGGGGLAPHAVQELGEGGGVEVTPRLHAAVGGVQPPTGEDELVGHEGVALGPLAHENAGAPKPLAH